MKTKSKKGLFCLSVSLVAVIAAFITGGICYGASISGWVLDEQGSPVPRVPVKTYLDRCSQQPNAVTESDESGFYRIEGLQEGSYFVAAEAGCHTPYHNFNTAWWNETGGVSDCQDAGVVTVLSGQEAGDVDFGLFQGDTYLEPLVTSAGVFVLNKPKAMPETIYWAFISGPSPEDVCAFTVQGASGLFELKPSLSYRQWGILYLARSDTVAENGPYTFALRDSFGRTASVVKDFVYGAPLPSIDSETMSPEHGSYVGTTPVLSFQGASEPGLFYQIRIKDYHSNAISYTTERLQDTTSFTVPEGFLQPSTPYIWMARVWRGAEGMGLCQESEEKAFFTGPVGTPVLDYPSALSILTSLHEPDFLNWLGVMSRNTAPWDVASLTVTDPQDTVYTWTGDMSFWFRHPPYLSLTLPHTGPLPEGDYTFALQDRDFNTQTVTTTYTFDPVPPIQEEGRAPAPNAYVDTATPTFTWTALPAEMGEFEYRLRIRDYTEKIIWYDSPYRTATSVTVPQTVRLLRGCSYKWTVMVRKPGSSCLAYSRSHTFTIHPLQSPKPTITANGMGGTVFVRPSDVTVIQASLDPGEMAGQMADWWVGAMTRFGNFWLDPDLNWRPSGTPLSVGTFPLFGLGPVTLLQYPLPTGVYTFFFLLDQSLSGSLDEVTWFDVVTISSSPEEPEMQTVPLSNELSLKEILPLLKR